MYYFFLICTKIYSFFCPLLNSVVLKVCLLCPVTRRTRNSWTNVSAGITSARVWLMTYDDLCVIKAVLPNITKASRDYHRWRNNEMILENLLGMCLRLLSDCLRHLHGLAV